MTRGEQRYAESAAQDWDVLHGTYSFWCTAPLRLPSLTAQFPVARLHGPPRFPKRPIHPPMPPPCLRRLGFAILFFAVPLAALFTRRALVVMAPLAVILLVLASVLDGSARNAREKLTALMVSPGGVAGMVLLLWAGLSLVWTPFLPQASERLLNITGMALMALGGYLAVPERMRSANLYLLPVGVGLAALIGDAPGRSQAAARSTRRA